jgi:hypothetical protein
MMNEGSTVAEAMVDREGRTRNILSKRYVIVINVTDKLQKGGKW